jgi:flagellar biosynthetic protein FlhB
MNETDWQDRTEGPSPRRLEDARKRGQVPRSRELGVTLTLAFGALLCIALGPWMGRQLLEVMRPGLAVPRPLVFDESALFATLHEAVTGAVLTLLPVFAVSMASAFLGATALGGWTLYAGAVSPKPERLDPVKGMQRMFGLRGFLEVAKALAKFALVAGATVLVTTRMLPDLVSLAGLPVNQGIAEALRLTTVAFLALAAVTLPVALVDMPLQGWEHLRQLRMTRQELREELKETEGRPELKGRIRKLQQEFSRARMMSEVPRASVVITNPSHYAVALRYRPGRDPAPVLLARGRDLVALEIIHRATAAGVPRLTAPALARAIYYSTRLNEQIPTGLFLAVARVLSYVYQLRRGGANDRRPSPPRSDELPIPETLRS